MSIKWLVRDFVINFFCAIFFFSKSKAVVFLIHSIAKDKHWLSLDTDLFEKILLSLKAKGYVFSGYSNLSQVQTNSFQKVIYLTFDDGFENNYTNAVPILKKLNIPAVFFISTNFIGKERENGLKCMSWEQLKEIADNPLFTIGSHAKDHVRFTEISEAKAREELLDSKKILENSLQKKIDAFAFPYGVYNSSLKEIVKECGYSFCFTTERKRLSKGFSVFEIPRYVVDGQSYKFVSAMPFLGYEFYWKLYKKIFRR